MRKGERGIKSLGTASGRAALRARASARAMGGLSAGLRSVGRSGLYATGALAAGGGFLAKRSIDEWREAGKVSRVTAARIESTGKAAGLSTRQIADMSRDLSNLTAIDDEEIQNVANRLLTFTDLGSDLFRPALRAAIDMGAEFGNSGSAATQLGKALQDPIKGATALRRMGVNLNEQQQEQLKTWVEQGEKAKAQRWILRELQREFGGTARAQSDALGRLQVAWQNTEEALGGVIGPPAMALADAFADRLIDLQPEVDRFGDRMKGIWGDDEDLRTNLRQSRVLFRRELGPVWADVKRDIERANLDDKLLDAFSDAVPRIAETAGEGGGRAMVAFGRGWLRAPFWSQLLTVAFLGGRLGAFGPLG
ncbi:MAG TPA: phage tail length tape measure family protein, partial [Solirubrobacteraceae bacterium]|nr:phage tail length tape measure family protein [Solirubrobacteraceae bacterium]